MVESQPPNNPAPGRSPLQGTFVGRLQELTDLKTALEDTLAGQGRLVMLAGEPGIGKTRTAQELTSHADALGAQVFWGRCYEEEGTPPYWPWLQLLRSYIQQQSPEQLLSHMGPGAADIAEIVPELGANLPNLETPPALEPEQARFRLFSSITNCFKNAAQFQPLMLVLDDLHWADRSSLLLLEFLAREIQTSPLLVLGTYRDVEVSRRHPLSQTLGSLIREQHFLRVQLSGLAEAEVEQLIQGTSATNLPPGLSATIHRRTEGNPLFVTEIIRMLPGGGIGEGQDYTASIPEGVRDAIGRRLNQLSKGCNQVLTTASVIGREFDFKLLNALMDDLTEASLLELVEEALEGHIIEELPEGRERYQFSHALIQETLSEELSNSRKVRLHGRIAEALEAFYGVETEAHASELAHHFAGAEPVLGPEKLVHYSLLAGERALATFAYEEAIGHYERALAVKEQQQIDEEQAVLLFGLAQARLATWGRFQTQETREIVTILRRVFDFFVEVGDLDRAVTVAEHPVRTSLGVVIGEAELITAALALVPSDSHAAGRLLSTYGLILYQEKGDYQGAQEAFGQALEIAKRAQDTALEVRALAYTADVDFFHLHWQECLEKGQRAIKLSGRVEDLHAQAVSGFFMARVLDYLGDSNGAGEQVEALLARAERLRNRDWLGEGLYIAGVLFLHQGDWQRSRDFIDRALGTPRPSAPHLCARAVLDYQPGDFDQGQYHVERLVEATRRSALGTGFA